MSLKTPDSDALAAEIDALVDRCRIQCLWFLRPDFYPRNLQERLRVLDQIERHGDREAFLHAGRLRRWLSASSSAPSAGS
jgi:hypothetical protein